MKFEIDKTYTNNLGAKVALLYRTGNNLAFIGAMGVYYTDLEGQCPDPGKSVQPPLKFKIGKHYTTKLGLKTKLEAIAGDRLIFKGLGAYFLTTTDGKAVWDHQDIVGECKDFAPDAKTTCDLKVGGIYKLRGGGIAKVMQIQGTTLDVAYLHNGCTGVGNSYPISGKWWSHDEPHPLDILNEPVLVLEVGKYYKTRSGRKVKVLAINPDSFVPAEVEFTDSGENRGYPLDGCWRFDKSAHKDDILEKWVEPSKPALKLEVGKYYKTRTGHKVRVAEIRKNSLANTPVTLDVWTDCGVIQSAYPLDGQWLFGNAESPLDIVSEWVEPPKPALKLEVGKYYKTRAGHKAKVERIGGPSVSHNVTVTTFDRPNPTTRTYTPQGQWAINLHESSLDLVAEWVEPEPVLEEGDIVIATTKGGREFVRIFAEYCDSEPKVYLDGSFYGSIAGNWASVKLLQKGKNAEA